jgi:hypothetical protein
MAMESTIRLTESIPFRIRKWFFMETLLAAKGDPKPNGCFTGDEKVPVAERSSARED